MKKTISTVCSLAILLTLVGCNKSSSLPDDGSMQASASESVSANSESTVNSESTASSSETSAPAVPDIPRQKISELRGELDKQVETVKNTEYRNLHFTEDFTVKVPDTDVLYDLTLTQAKLDFETAYELFDKTFDREFGDIYTSEDKEKLYHVAVIETDLGFNTDSALLSKNIDKLKSGEYTYSDIYVQTDKAYLTVKPATTGIHGLNHDGVVKRAHDEERGVVALAFATSYFDIAGNYLDVNSEDRYEILDGELSVKEAGELAKKIVSENKYAWGGALEPDVIQIKVLDIGEGKYGFSFTMTPSYKGVLFDAYEFQSDGSFGTRNKKFDHEYILFAPRAFMMENGKFDSFSGAGPEYSVTQDAEYDSVISFKDVIQMLTEKFGGGMDLSLSRAELLYSGMYPADETDDNTVMKSNPVWKFRCYNARDNLKYIVYINAVNGKVEYYVADWWEV